MKCIYALLIAIALSSSALGESQVWSFRPNFIYDPWNEPILPFVATVPAGERVAPENIRAMVKSSALAELKAAAAPLPGRRLVKRSVVSRLKTEADVQKARGYLLPPAGSVVVDAFQIASGYVDKFGLLAILQSVAKWQCAADETCPEKIATQLDVLLETDGVIQKTETFTEINGKNWIIATITYEVPLGNKIRVVPLRSRMLEVMEAR